MRDALREGEEAPEDFQKRSSFAAFDCDTTKGGNERPEQPSGNSFWDARAYGPTHLASLGESFLVVERGGRELPARGIPLVDVIG